MSAVLTCTYTSVVRCAGTPPTPARAASLPPNVRPSSALAGRQARHARERLQGVPSVVRSTVEGRGPQPLWAAETSSAGVTALDAEVHSATHTPAEWKAAGVYAILDADLQVRYIGVAKDVAVAVKRHASAAPQVAVSAQVEIASVASKDELTNLWKRWLKAHVVATSALPEGNQKGNEEWKSHLKVAPKSASPGTVSKEVERRAQEAWNAKPPAERVAICSEAVRANPNDGDALYGLGMALDELGSTEEAIIALQAAVAVAPENAAAAHLLTALQPGNVTPDNAPADYVRDLFDSYADTFDEHLTQRLKYVMPDRLREAVLRVTGVEPGSRAWTTLDAGCGSGLSGEVLKDVSKAMIGVDLSPGMLEKAAERRIYDELIEGDLVPAIEKYVDFRDGTGLLDLLVALDVLVYMGDLDALFGASATALKPGAWLGISVEEPDVAAPKGFVLRKTGRFAHSKEYVEGLAAKHGFVIRSCESIQAREDHGTPILENLVMLQRDDGTMTPSEAGESNNCTETPAPSWTVATSDEDVNDGAVAF